MHIDTRMCTYTYSMIPSTTERQHIYIIWHGVLITNRGIWRGDQVGYPHLTSVADSIWMINLLIFLVLLAGTEMRHHQNMTFPSSCTSRLVDTEQELHIREPKQVIKWWRMIWHLQCIEDVCFLIFCSYFSHFLQLEATDLLCPPRRHTARELPKGNRAVCTSTGRILLISCSCCTPEATCTWLLWEYSVPYYQLSDTIRLVWKVCTLATMILVS